MRGVYRKRAQRASRVAGPRADTVRRRRGVPLADLLGNYELLDLIGRGGMGEVWRARQPSLGRLVAVKLVRSGALGGGPDADRVVLERFVREARTAAALNSPHAVRIQDFGTAADGSFFQVMELLEGLDLQQLVERHGAVPPARAVGLLRQACDALAEAHARGFVHRDVKPSNLFLARGGTQEDLLKVLDFGLARGPETDAGLTQTGVVPGSPAYLAPELLRGADPTDKADIYALGCVAWWLLCGRMVFEGRSALELVVAHLERTPRGLAEVAPSPVPPGLAALVAACLAKDPAARPGARELARALAALPAWTPEEAEAWWERHPAAPAPAIPVATRPFVPVARAPLPRLREEAAGALRRHFEESRIDLGDLDRRLAVVAKAETPEAVDAALVGLPAVPAPAPAPALPAPVPTPGPELPAPAAAPAVVAVFSNVSRKGAWELGGTRKVVAVMGSATLDLRDVDLPPGCTELVCVAVMGSIEIVVSPNLFVDMGGVGVLGNFESRGLVATRPDPDRPWIRVKGSAVMGSVEVIGKGPPDPRLTRLAELGAATVEAVVEQIATAAGVGRRKRLPKPRGE